MDGKYLHKKTMRCRRCKKMSEPIPFGYCKKCAEDLGAVFKNVHKDERRQA